MEKAKSGVIRTLTLSYDLVNGVMDYDNPDDMTYLEVLGLVKFFEVMLTAEMLADQD